LGAKRCCGAESSRSASEAAASAARVNLRGVRGVFDMPCGSERVFDVQDVRMA
jgi:hypothetical protein